MNPKAQQTKVTANLSDFETYSWFLYTGKPNLVRYAKEDLFVTLKTGALFGVRYAKDGLEKQLVVADPKLGLEKVIKLDSMKEQLLYNNHAKIDRDKAKTLYETHVGGSSQKRNVVDSTLAPKSQEVARLLVQKGFSISAEHCEDYGRVKNAYSGSLSVKDTCKLIESVGITRELQQYKGHVNFKDPSSTSGNDLVQVSQVSGKTLVILAW